MKSWRLFLLAIVLFAGNAIAADDSCRVQSRYNSSLILPPDFTPTVNDEAAPNGTVLRVITARGECIGKLTYTHSDTAGQSAPIWGHDPVTSNENGASVGDTLLIQAKIAGTDRWTSTSTVYQSGNPLYDNSGHYHHDRLYVLKKLSAKHDELPGVLAVKSVYPNPSISEATLLISLPAEARLQVRIFNALGREVRHQNLGTVAGGSQRITIDTRTLPSGVYFFRLAAHRESENTIREGKFTVIN